MASVPLSAVGILGGRWNKQTVSVNVCDVGLRLDSLEAAGVRRARSNLHLQQVPVSLLSIVSLWL